MDIMFIVLTLLTFVTFFGISITAIAFWLKTPKVKLNSKDLHWAFKGLIYYGIFFTIFIVSSVFLSFIVLLAFVINGGRF